MAFEIIVMIAHNNIELNKKKKKNIFIKNKLKFLIKKKYY
jgi:hypothetical protein